VSPGLISRLLFFISHLLQNLLRALNLVAIMAIKPQLLVAKDE